MIAKSTVKWGLWGAVYFLVVYVIACALRVLCPDNEQIHSVLVAMASPVLFLWQVVGVHGEAAMAFGIPIIVSTFLFPAILGFGVGVITHRIFGSR